MGSALRAESVHLLSRAGHAPEAQSHQERGLQTQRRRQVHRVLHGQRPPLRGCRGAWLPGPHLGQALRRGVGLGPLQCLRGQRTRHSRGAQRARPPRRHSQVAAHVGAVLRVQGRAPRVQSTLRRFRHPKPLLAHRLDLLARPRSAPPARRDHLRRQGSRRRDLRGHAGQLPLLQQLRARLDEPQRLLPRQARRDSAVALHDGLRDGLAGAEPYVEVLL